LPKVIPVRRVVYDAYARHPAGRLLRPRRQRPRYRRTAEKRDELAPSNARHGASLPKGRRSTA